MVILLEKDTPFFPPPPPYHTLRSSQNAASSSSRLAVTSRLTPSASRSSLLTTSTATIGPSHHRTASLAVRSVTLPSHIVLHILYATLPDADEARIYTREELAQRTTKVLYWMAASTRRIARNWYLASMHILRSTYLQAYLSHVKKPYTSDPFPHWSTSSASTASTSTHADANSSPVLSLQRETQILDLFLLFHLRDTAHALDSALHLSYTTTSITSPSYEYAYTYAGIDASEADDAPLRDLFDFMQPRARLSDLLRIYGSKAGLIEENSGTTDIESDVKRLSHTHAYAVPFSRLSISFAPRRVGIQLTSPSSKSKSTIIEITRLPSEPLERCASRLVVELKAWADAQSYRDDSLVLFESERDKRGNEAGMRVVLRERAEAIRKEREKEKENERKKGKKGLRSWFGR